MKYTGYEEPIRECLTNGERLQYDGCGENLEESKEFYKGWEYLGSGHNYFINGTHNYSKTTLHFFKRQ